MIRRVAPLLGLLIVAGITAPAAPQDVDQGLLNAIAFQPIPRAQAVEVRVLDNSDENLAVMQELEAALRQRGLSVGGEEAPLLLTIDTGDSVGAWTAPGASDQIRMMDDRGRLFPQGELDMARQARLPLTGTTVVTPAQYRLGLTLDTRATGTRLWQGWAIADLSQGEPSELAAAMVPKLADSLGRTVREEPFNLQP